MWKLAELSSVHEDSWHQFTGEFGAVLSYAFILLLWFRYGSMCSQIDSLHTPVVKCM
jgi:hypothetical protein